jgi:2-hydroxychromene-2-carboxylate isomerase
VFRHVWRDGADANDAGRVAALMASVSPRRGPTSSEVKDELKAATAEAAARGVFGVPSIEVDGRLFWGLDGLEMLSAYLRGEPWFDGPEWASADKVPVGVQRKP